jgi:hypothetical protein
MNFTRLLRRVVIVVGFFGLSFGPALHAAEKVLLDFTDVRQDPGDEKVMRCYDYIWNDWAKYTTDKRRVGTIIRSPNGKGNLGQQSTDVDFGKTPALQLDYVVINGNQAKSIAFHLVDGDGTEAIWNVPLDVAAGKAVAVRMDLAKPSRIDKPGKKPGLDAKHVSEWSISGDWSDTSVQVVLLKLKAVQ